jgi:hypothetical protein
MRFRKSIPINLLNLLVAFISLDCSDDSPTSPESGTPNDGFKLETTVTIGNQGGTISSDEFSLIVPASSFNQQTELKLYSKEDSSLFGEETATKLFKLEGLPTNFTNPLKISLKYNTTIKNRSSIAISDEFTDDYTDETGIIYDLNDAIDSSGFLVGFLETPSDNSIIYPLQSKKTSSANDENNVQIQGIHNILTLESENFSIKFPSSYGQTILGLSTILEKNYAIIKDTLNLVFSKDPNNKWLVQFTFGDNISNIKYKRPQEFLINRKHWEEAGMSVVQIELGCLLVSAALTGEYYRSKLTFPDDGWLIMAVRLWSSELFATDNNSFRSFFNDKFYPNALAPFNGLRLGAGINNRKMSISHGLGMAAFCKYIFEPGYRKQVGKIFESTTKEIGVTANLVENIGIAKNVWWHNFLGFYIHTDHILFPNFLYNVEGSVFAQTVDDIWNITDSEDTLKIFSSENANVGQYPDLSAKRFMINLNYPNISESKDLVITIEEANGIQNNDLTSLCFIYNSKNNSNFFLNESTNGVFRIADLKGYYDDGFNQYLIVAVNSKGEAPYTNYSDVNLKMKIEDHVDEFGYTKCWVKVKIGSATYLKTNLTTGSSFNSSTSGQSFGQIAYEGSYSSFNNTFNGIYYQINTSGSSIDTISGSIKVELNQSRDLAYSISFNQTNRSYNSNLNSSNFWDIVFSADNIPLEDENDPGTFSVKGGQVCNSIYSLDVFHRSHIPNDPNNNYEETLQSFQCDLGDEEITIYFSK